MNPEAPLDDLQDLWKPQPQSSWWWLPIGVLLVLTIGGLTVAFLWGPGG